MKRSVLIGITFILSCIVAKGQFIINLPGTPLNTTGWTLRTPTTFTTIDTVVLNASKSDTTGYIYYDSAFALSSCAAFQVDFDFRVRRHSAQGPGQGFAFWLLNTPPSGGVPTGTGEMGVPNGSVGAALFFDTHDDDNLPDNPAVSLLYLTGTNNYIEGVTTSNTIGSVPNVNYVTDTTWHHCKIVYNNGNWKVYLNGNFSPSINANKTLANITGGHFGFSSATATNFYSEHDLKNITIVGSAIAMPSLPPTTTINLTYCQDTLPGSDSVSLNGAITGDSVIWYDATTLTQLPGAPTISVHDTTCFTYYVTQYTICGESPKDTVNVCVTTKPPSPSFTYPPQYCVGDPFQPFPVVPDVIWYDQPVGGVGSPNPPVISTAVPDTFNYYPARLINGCESERATITVVVLPKPVPDFSFTIKYGCVADTVMFTNLTPVADSVVWSFGDGTVIMGKTSDTTIKNPIHLYYSQSQFDVKLIAVNGSSGCMDSITKKLNNLHPLIARIRYDDDTVCQGVQVNFRDSSTYNIFGTQSYYWDFGDGDTSTLKDPPHIYPHPGVYQVMHAVTDFVPCHDTTYHTVVVDSAGVMGFALSDSFICEGARVTFTGDFTDIGLMSYTWDFGDGFIIDNLNPINHTFDTAGMFSIKLSGVYRACPNIDSTVNLAVMPYPRISLGSDTSLCPNGPGIAIGDYNNQNSPTAKWLWSTGDSTAVITVRHPGIYTARVTDGGCSSSDSVEVFKDCYIDIPNSFTPNNDGVNDYFLPRQLLSKSVVKFNMQVFNRWGELVFKTDKIDGRGWDGKFNGKDQPLGVYVYLIDVELAAPSSENLPNFTEHYQGNVTLLR